MRPWLKMAAVAMALAVLLGGALAGCGGGGAGPEDTVRGALQAMEDLDAEKMASYFVEDARQDIEEGMQFVFEMIDELKLYNVKTRVVSQSGDSATVEMEFDGDITVFGEEESEHTKDTIDLVKVGGKWLIEEEAFLE
jgi:hypothetical protein